MVHPSTLRALGRRAPAIANSLQYLAGQLSGEMKKQGIALYPSDWSDPLTDDNEPMMVPRGLMRGLIRSLHEQVEEIRKFSN